jgi:DNA-damage-inducible protein J
MATVLPIMSDTIVRARVEAQIKKAAMSNAKAIGLDLSTILRMVVNRLAVDPELSADLFLPNKTTIKAINDLNKGIGVGHASNIAELKQGLGW